MTDSMKSHRREDFHSTGLVQSLHVPPIGLGQVAAELGMGLESDGRTPKWFGGN